MKKCALKRGISEAKINLIKMLSECETEEELIRVMKLKEDFMNNFCSDEKNPELLKDLPDFIKTQIKNDPNTGNQLNTLKNEEDNIDFYTIDEQSNRIEELQT